MLSLISLGLHRQAIRMMEPVELHGPGVLGQYSDLVLDVTSMFDSDGEVSCVPQFPFLLSCQIRINRADRSQDCREAMTYIDNVGSVKGLAHKGVCSVCLAFNSEQGIAGGFAWTQGQCSATTTGSHK